MKKLILHIGLPKTGSTSIQNTLAGYSDATHRHADLHPDGNHSIRCR